MRGPSEGGLTPRIRFDRPGGVLKAGISLFVAGAALVVLFVGLTAVFEWVGRAVGMVMPALPQWIAHLLFYVVLGVVIVGFFAGVFKVLGHFHGPY